MSTLADHLSRLRVLPSDDSLDYYAMTVTADEDGQIIIATQSHWVDFADVDRRIELREASLVNATNMLELWTSIGQPPIVIARRDDVPFYFLLGGNALVERSIAEERFPDALKPYPCHPDGFAGFVSPSLLEPTALKRAPTPKLRMKIMTRDQRRCRVCGRCPDDHTDVELHIHHIRPWASGGVTADKNLITLCHTCHAGLAPHYDPSLFAYTSTKKSPPYGDDYHEGVKNYRKISFACFETVRSV